MEIKNKRTILLPILLIIAGLAILYSIVASKYEVWPFHKTSQPTTISSKPRGTAAPVSVPQNTTAKTTQPGSDPSPAPAPSTTGGKATVTVNITAASHDSSTLYIRAVIESVTSTGTCTLQMQSSTGRTYTATSAVQAGPSTSTCKGFNIPLSQLSNGQWTIKLIFENPTTQGTTTKDLTL